MHKMRKIPCHKSASHAHRCSKHVPSNALATLEYIFSSKPLASFGPGTIDTPIMLAHFWSGFGDAASLKGFPSF
jgi:hypothetical protein